MTTGMWCVESPLLSRRQTSNPSRSGIITSSSTTSHSARSQINSASRPLAAVVTSKYSAERRASRSFTLAGTSSTTRTRAVIDGLSSVRPQEAANGLDELADRDRLRQIGLATAFADSLLVALHCERGDRHDRNGIELRIFLQPFCHFEARDLGQLDVHQDQVGPMAAREIERLDAVARAHRLVAVGLEQVVEELHVELVVFHDHDGLCHPRPSRRPSVEASSGMTVKRLVTIPYGKANAGRHPP